MRPVIVCLLLFLAFSQQNIRSNPAGKTVDQKPAAVQPPLVIRVGAIYYDDSDESYSEIKKYLSAIEKAAQSSPEFSARTITFKPVVGTYDEVMNWYLSDQIDLAIMNPGPLALLLKRYTPEDRRKIFVGIRGRIPPKGSVAYANNSNARTLYNSVMLLNENAIRKEFDGRPTKPTDAELMDLVVRKANQNPKQVHFFFVHPLSTSGYIFPRKVLQSRGVKLDAADYELTYSHDVSTKRVSDSGYDSDGRLQVAFVSDETRTTASDPRIRAVQGGEMSTNIVQDALLLTPDFLHRESEAAENVKKLLRSGHGPETFNLSFAEEEWWKGYEEVGRWINTFGSEKMLLSNDLTLDQIITRINNYNRHHPDDPARVALVLSGGGAKCAYQLGAVGIIEDRLEAAQKANPSQKLGIDLVVGTSGGAINALTIAAEVTKDPNRRPQLVSTWESFRQSDILKPSNFVRRLLGLALGLIIALIIVCAVYIYRQLRRRVTRFTLTEITGTILLVLALVFFLLGLRQVTVTSRVTAETLLRRHVLVHVAEYGRQSLRWAALALFICGVLLCLDAILSPRQSRAGQITRVSRPLLVMGAVLLSLILPIVTLYRIFASEKTLFVSEGIVDTMQVEMPKLLGFEASSRSLPDMSRTIIEQGLIKRDLVITGSMLETPSLTKDDKDDDTDLYFVYRTGANAQLPEKLQKDNRFVSLRDPANASILLDTVIGSGAIFPAFEPRRLGGVKRVMDSIVTPDVPIIDGGFVHNSPIEAAVKMDATHIIVIEASPASRPSEEVNLVNNSVAAFNHLFTQAQLLDARSRRQAEIFTLQPATPSAEETPFLCTLDFGTNFITRAIKWGADDAQNTKTPRFVRQPRPSGL